MRVEKNPKHLHIEFIVTSHNSALFVLLNISFKKSCIQYIVSVKFAYANNYSDSLFKSVSFDICFDYKKKLDKSLISCLMLKIPIIKYILKS